MSKYVGFVNKIGLIGSTQFLIGLSGLILIPILTKNLSLENYGLWLLIMISISLIPTLSSLGLPYAMVRFLAASKDLELIREGFYSVLSTVLILNGIFSITIFIAAKPIADFLLGGEIFIVQIIAMSIFILSIQLVFINFFRTFQKFRYHSVFLFLKKYLMILFVAVFVFTGYDLVGALIGVIVSEFLVTLIFGIIIIQEIGLCFPKYIHIKKYFAFGMPTVPQNISSWVVNSSDQYLIGLFLGNSWVGYYGSGYSLGIIIKNFISPIITLLPPVLSNEYDINNQRDLSIYLNYPLKYFLAIAIPSIFGLSLLSEPILTIISTPEIAAKGYPITSIVALSYLLFGLYTFSSQHFVLEKNTYLLGKLWIFAAILNFGLNLIFIPYLGIYGAALTTLFAFAFVLLVVMYYSPRMFDFQIIGGFIGKSLFASVVMSSIIILIEPIELLQIILIIAVCIVVYLITLYLIKGFSKKELIFFKTLFSKK